MAIGHVTLASITGTTILVTYLKWSHGPLIRYVKLRIAHAPGMPGTFSPPPRISDPDMHHGTCGFLWSRWRGKRSRHSRRMRNPQNISGKRPICSSFEDQVTSDEDFGCTISRWVVEIWLYDRYRHKYSSPSNGCWATCPNFAILCNGEQDLVTIQIYSGGMI